MVPLPVPLPVIGDVLRILGDLAGLAQQFPYTGVPEITPENLSRNIVLGFNGINTAAIEVLAGIQNFKMLRARLFLRGGLPGYSIYAARLRDDLRQRHLLSVSESYVGAPPTPPPEQQPVAKRFGVSPIMWTLTLVEVLEAT